MSTDTATRLERMIELAREEYHEAAEELAGAEAVIGTLRDRKKAALQILRLYDPEADELVEDDRKRKAKRERGKKPSGPSSLGEANRADIAAWLREHEDDPLLADGFTARDLPRHPEWNGRPGASGVKTALSILADEGVVRLDRIGWTNFMGQKDPGKKGRAGKVYKVVRHASD
jgi:hypothetical protein